MLINKKNLDNKAFFSFLPTQYIQAQFCAFLIKKNKQTC